jgi:hypothetical protein
MAPAGLAATDYLGLMWAVATLARQKLLLLEAISLFLPSESSGGRSHLEVYYAGREVTFHLPYAGFGWLPLLPSPWIQGVGVLLGLGAVGLGLGFHYRISALLTFLAWAYLYAVESTRTYWMSYYYLELLVLFLMPFLPAAARFSVDEFRFRPGGEPHSLERRSDRPPRRGPAKPGGEPDVVGDTSERGKRRIGRAIPRCSRPKRAEDGGRTGIAKHAEPPETGLPPQPAPQTEREEEEDKEHECVGLTIPRHSCFPHPRLAQSPHGVRVRACVRIDS